MTRENTNTYHDPVSGLEKDLKIQKGVDIDPTNQPLYKELKKMFTQIRTSQLQEELKLQQIKEEKISAENDLLSIIFQNKNPEFDANGNAEIFFNGEELKTLTGKDNEVNIFSLLLKLFTKEDLISRYTNQDILYIDLKKTGNITRITGAYLE